MGAVAWMTQPVVVWGSLWQNMERDVAQVSTVSRKTCPLPYLETGNPQGTCITLKVV